MGSQVVENGGYLLLSKSVNNKEIYRKIQDVGGSSLY
jgi:hypothetical protein